MLVVLVAKRITVSPTPRPRVGVVHDALTQRARRRRRRCGDGGAFCETFTYQQNVNETWVTPAAAVFLDLEASGESYAYVPSNDLPLCAASDQNERRSRTRLRRTGSASALHRPSGFVVVGFRCERSAEDAAMLSATTAFVLLGLGFVFAQPQPIPNADTLLAWTAAVPRLKSATAVFVTLKLASALTKAARPLFTNISTTGRSTGSDISVSPRATSTVALVGGGTDGGAVHRGCAHRDAGLRCRIEATVTENPPACVLDGVTDVTCTLTSPERTVTPCVDPGTERKRGQDVRSAAASGGNRQRVACTRRQRETLAAHIRRVAERLQLHDWEGDQLVRGRVPAH